MNWADRCRNAVAVGRPLLRIDARRSASWIAGVTAVTAGAWLAACNGGGPLVAAAIASGGLLGVAAIGRLPVGVSRGHRSPWRWPLITRSVWPAAGFLVGAAVTTWSGDVGGRWSCVFAAAVTAAIALAATAAESRPGRSEATAASLLLGITAAGAAAAVAIWAGGWGLVLQAVGGLLAGGLTASASLLDRGGDVRDWLGPIAARRSGPEAGPLVAMTASLVAMVGCYFLAPQYAWAYVLLATGLFVCLAVPLATEATPAAASFLRSAAGRPPLPGSLPRAARITAVYLGILGWPALVAIVLPAASGERVSGPLTAILGLTAAGACLVALAAVAALAGWGETARAVALAMAAAAAVAAAAQSERFSKLPKLTLASEGTPLVAHGSGVEPCGCSCKTPQSAQPSMPARAARLGSRMRSSRPDNTSVGSCRS